MNRDTATPAQVAGQSGVKCLNYLARPLYCNHFCSLCAHQRKSPACFTLQVGGRDPHDPQPHLEPGGAAGVALRADWCLWGPTRNRTRGAKSAAAGVRRPVTHGNQPGPAFSRRTCASTSPLELPPPPRSRQPCPRTPACWCCARTVCAACQRPGPWASWATATWPGWRAASTPPSPTSCPPSHRAKTPGAQGRRGWCTYQCKVRKEQAAIRLQQAKGTAAHTVLVLLASALAFLFNSTETPLRHGACIDYPTKRALILTNNLMQGTAASRA